MKSWVEYTLSGEIEINHTHCIKLSTNSGDRFIKNNMLVNIACDISSYLKDKGYEVVSVWGDDKGNHYIKWMDDEYLHDNEELLMILRASSYNCCYLKSLKEENQNE